MEFLKNSQLKVNSKKFDPKRIVGNNSIQPVSFANDDTEVKSKQVAQSHPTR